MAERQIRSIEEEMASKAALLERLRASTESLAVDCAGLQRDLEMWKSQCETCTRSRKGLEKDFAEARQEFAREKLKLQEASDGLKSRCAAREADLASVQEQITELKRQTTVRDTELTVKVSALEDFCKKTQAQLQSAKESLMATTESLAHQRTDAAQIAQENTQAVARLERDFEMKRREAAEANARLQQAPAQEAREGQEAREQYEGWREAHAQSLRQVQDESSLRLAHVEKERTRTEERYRSEIGDSQRHVVHHGKRVEALEHDFSRVKYLLNESLSNLNWVRQEREREEKDLGQTKRQLTEEVRSAGNALEAAKRNEATVQ